MALGILVAAAYVAGSMPWGYWLVRIFRGEDIRRQGRGNIGATNVWRVYGPRLGLPALALDTAKGFVPAFVATKLEGHGAGVLAGGAAMVGHWRPLFLRFQKGGKMVAPAGGAVESRTTRRVASSTCSVSKRCRSSSRTSRLTAVRPISASGCRTVVSAGLTTVACSTSSNPTMETSSGTESPRSRAARTAP